MKKIVSFILFFLSQLSFAQEQMTLVEDPVFELKDVTLEPSFPGGNDGFYQFIGINFKQPEVPQLIGKVFVSFIVEKDGTLTDIRVIKDVGFGAGAEAERVIRLSPRWRPGVKEGKPVRVLNIVAIPIQTK
jgi:protein TonB